MMLDWLAFAFMDLAAWWDKTHWDEEFSPAPHRYAAYLVSWWDGTRRLHGWFAEPFPFGGGEWDGWRPGRYV